METKMVGEIVSKIVSKIVGTIASKIVSEIVGKISRSGIQDQVYS
jgi:hypothetical protein